MTHEVQTGSLVRTSDGKDLGKVKDVRGGMFKIDARMAPDYWLSNDCVTNVSPGEATHNLTDARGVNVPPGISGDVAIERGVAMEGTLLAPGGYGLPGDRAISPAERMASDQERNGDEGLPVVCVGFTGDQLDEYKTSEPGTVR